MAKSVTYVDGTGWKVSQLTGDTDLELGVPTASRTGSRYGLLGMDYGVPVVIGSTLWFYFGDGVPAAPDATRFLWSKSAGYVPLSPLIDPEAPIAMRLLAEPGSTKGSTGLYLPPTVSDPTIVLGNYLNAPASSGVPTAAFELEGTPAVFFTQTNFTQSFLAWSSTGSTHAFDRHYPVGPVPVTVTPVTPDNYSSFTILAAVVVDRAAWPGLPPGSGPGVLIYGIGGRGGVPYLAWADAASVFDATRGTRGWSYFAGMEAGSQMPVWTSESSLAVPVAYRTLTEFSVMSHPLGCWLLFSGINTMFVLSSAAPWGPWSSDVPIFNPYQASHWAWGVFIHCPPCQDSLWQDWSAIPGVGNNYGKDAPGAFYAPFVIPPLTVVGPAPGQTNVYYTLSLGNPYQTVVMRAGLLVQDVPDPPRWRGNPALVQLRSGTRGDFQVVAPRAAGGLAELVRHNDIGPAIPWTWPLAFGGGGDVIDGLAFVLASANGGLSLVVYRTGDQLKTILVDASTPSALVADGSEAHGVSGNPAVVQGTYGANGMNVELVTPLASGGLAHYWQDNDVAEQPWHGPIPFAQADGSFEAVAMTFTSTGTLEVVARRGERLLHYSRTAGPEFAWQPARDVHSGVRGTPAIIQARDGLLHVVTPLAGGGLEHFVLPSHPTTPPRYSVAIPVFGASAGDVDGVSLIQGPYADNFELIALAGDRLMHFWRDSAPQHAWSGPFYLAGA